MERLGRNVKRQTWENMVQTETGEIKEETETRGRGKEGKTEKGR